MIPPRFIRCRDAPACVGVDRNRFDGVKNATINWSQ
ncbi:hypothetical protein Rta_33160 [Ramlibacter tataouinensis TTB310]|uniref:Uncharacterized protein n=1 Tax=Ramlibacter tataouinensis (strain ATCC BAA-407 / DSM 14655 / LMG 21543 / TTB310) TaxID=365046 RepID=F5XYR1_RAMTT|nr:hypothetical protein Rta_33160 [Ramlibacter tataouinensis TTB310]